MCVLSVIAFDRQLEAQDARATSDANTILAESSAAEARELALIGGAQAALAKDDVDTALALAVAANRFPNPPGQAQTILSKAAYEPGTRLVFRTMQGDRNAQIKIAFSPDGRKALFGGTDSESPVSLWDVETGQLIHSMKGHTAWVESVGFHPDNRTAFSMSMDRTIIIWNLDTGEKIRRFGSDLITGSEYVTATYSPDGRYILSNNGHSQAEADADLILWDAQTGEAVRTFNGHSGPTGAVAISPDGRMALSGADFGELILWNLQTGGIIQRFGERGEDWRKLPSEILFRPDGHTVLVAHFDSTMTLWDLDTYQSIRHFGTPQAKLYGAYSAGITADGRFAIGPHYLPNSSSGWDFELSYWDLETGAILFSIPTNPLGVALSPDGTLALTGSGDMRLWELTYGPEIRRIDVGEPVFNAALSPDGETILVTTGQQQCKLAAYNTATGQLLWQSQQSPLPYDAFCTRYILGLGRDSHTMLTGSEDDRVIVWEVGTGLPLRTFANHIGPVNALALSPDGRLALSADMTGLMLLWDVETLQEIQHFTAHEVTINDVAFSPDGRTAVSVDSGGLLVMWDIQTGQVIRRIQGQAGGMIVDVTYSPDGHAIVGSAEGGEIIWWDARTGQQIRVFRAPTGAVEEGAGTILFTPDGHSLLVEYSTGTGGGTVQLNAATGEIIREYPGMELEDLNPAGQNFLAVSGPAVYLLRIDSQEELLAWTLHHRYVRELSCDERALYHLEPACSSGRTFPTRTPYPTPQHATPTAASAAPGLAAALDLSPTPSVTPHPVLTAQIGSNRGEVAIGGYQVWEYSGSAGERLTIRVNADHPANWDTRSDNEPTPEEGWLDTVVIVTAPDGTDMNIYVIAGEVMFGPGESQDIEVGVNTDSLIENLVLPEDGTYLITVSGSGYQTGGAYTLTIETTPSEAITPTP
jgi:WD40 repeat protein